MDGILPLSFDGRPGEKVSPVGLSDPGEQEWFQRFQDKKSPPRLSFLSRRLQIVRFFGFGKMDGTVQPERVLVLPELSLVESLRDLMLAELDSMKL